MSATDSTPSAAVWDRVVCGIDGTPASLEAARQVARLMPASADLMLCAVVDLDSIEGDESVAEQLVRKAEDALGRAHDEIARVRPVAVCLRRGRPIRVLLAELAAADATLVVIGSHGGSRAAGIALGSVATAMLHDAPCSVLVARGLVPTEAAAGHEVAIAFDGSPAARRALATGRELGSRLALKPRVIVATGGPMTAPALPWLAERLEPEITVTEDARSAVDALHDASVSADLVIIGSRQLRGVPALASVSERVAHVAHCPVLVIR